MQTEDRPATGLKERLERFSRAKRGALLGTWTRASAVERNFNAEMLKRREGNITHGMEKAGKPASSVSDVALGELMGIGERYELPDLLRRMGNALRRLASGLRNSDGVRETSQSVRTGLSRLRRQLRKLAGTEPVRHEVFGLVGASPSLEKIGNARELLPTASQGQGKMRLANRIIPGQANQSASVSNTGRQASRFRQLSGRFAGAKKANRVGTLLSAVAGVSGRFSNQDRSATSMVIGLQPSIQPAPGDSDTTTRRGFSRENMRGFRPGSVNPKVNASEARHERSRDQGERETKVVVNHAPTIVINPVDHSTDLEARIMSLLARNGYELAEILSRETARRKRTTF